MVNAHIAAATKLLRLRAKLEKGSGLLWGASSPSFSEHMSNAGNLIPYCDSLTTKARKPPLEVLGETKHVVQRQENNARVKPTL